MLKQIQTDVQVEIRTLTPDLGLFIITGSAQDAETAAQSFGRLKEVSSSTFDRAATGQPPKRFVWL